MSKSVVCLLMLILEAFLHGSLVVEPEYLNWDRVIEVTDKDAIHSRANIVVATSGDSNGNDQRVTIPCKYYVHIEDFEDVSLDGRLLGGRKFETYEISPDHAYDVVVEYIVPFYAPTSFQGDPDLQAFIRDAVADPELPISLYPGNLRISNANFDPLPYNDASERNSRLKSLLDEYAVREQAANRRDLDSGVCNTDLYIARTFIRNAGAMSYSPVTLSGHQFSIHQISPRDYQRLCSVVATNSANNSNNANERNTEAIRPSPCILFDVDEGSYKIVDASELITVGDTYYLAVDITSD